MPVESVLGRGVVFADRSAPSRRMQLKAKRISSGDALDVETDAPNKECIPSRRAPSVAETSSTSTNLSNDPIVSDGLSTPTGPRRSKKRRFSQEPSSNKAEDDADDTPSTETAKSASPDPSPWCRSAKSQGCEDPRVLKRKLNSTYVGTTSSNEQVAIELNTSEAWHDRTSTILNTFITKNKAHVKRKNTALLAIQFVYELDGKLTHSKEFDINTFFISGGKEASSDLDLKSITSGGRTFNAKTVYDFLAGDDDPDHVTKHMRDVVLGYYKQATDTRLSAETIAARQKEANFAYLSPQAQKKLENGSCHANSSFEIAYLHSEQAMLLMLIKQTKILDPFLKTLPVKAIIHQTTLLISSKNQMCRKCGACYYVAGSESGILTTTLQNYIQNFPKKRFQIASNGLNVFTQVSALSVFDNVNLEHRLRQMRFANVPITNSRAFSPHVAQRCLLGQLPRKHRDEFEKPKTTLPKFVLPDDGDDK